MTDLHADVALLTEQRYTAVVAAEEDWYLDNILRDDQLLQAALARRGLSLVRIDWNMDKHNLTDLEARSISIVPSNSSNEAAR